MIRLLSRSVAVLLIVALAAGFAYAKVETYLGPSNAEIAKWKESMRGMKASERIVPQRAERTIPMRETDSELIPLPKNVVRNIDSEFHLANAFDAYINYFRDIVGQFIFTGTDSLGVWFRPATECKIKKVEVLFADDGSNENLGATFDVRIFDVKDDIPGIGGNGQYGFTEYKKIIPSPTGALLGEFQMNVTQTGFNEETGWTVVNIENFQDPIDVGKRDFFVAFEFPEGNTDDADVYYGPAEEQHAPGDYHSFKWYHDGGTYSPGTPNWVSRLNYSVRVLVEYYGDPPPDIQNVTEIPTQYYSCDPGPYEVSATVTDIGTDVFTGAVTKVNLIYFTEEISDADTIDITANKVGDVYTGEIPSHPVGTEIFYYIYAEDNGADNSADPVTHTSKTTPKSFLVLEANPDASILVLADGSAADVAMYESVLDKGGWIYDSWDIATLGAPSLCILQNYTSLFWLQGQGTGGGLYSYGLDVDVVPDYLDAGGNMLLVSSDYLGIVHGDDFSGDWKTATYSFVTDYLKVAEYNSDSNPDEDGNSADSLYIGEAGNAISGFLGDDTLMTMPMTKYYELMGSYASWADEVAPAAGAECPFYVWSEEDNDWVESSSMYNGTFKTVFIPWYLEAAADLDQFETVVKNILDFFGEKAAPLVNIELGPRYVVAANSGPYDVVATATDGDGTVTSVELGTSTDGESYTYATMAANGDVYEGSIPALSIGDTLFFQVKATDNDGLNGFAGPWGFSKIDFTPANDLLYCGDDPYDWYYGGNVDSIVVASLNRIGASYDKYDVDANGSVPPSYVGFLDQYESVIWHGYADWVESFPYATADNPFMPFIENGGNLLFSSEEMIGTLLGWDGYVTTTPGQSVYDVLGVSWYAPDRENDTLRIFPGSESEPLVANMDAELYLSELPFGYMGDIIDPVDWNSTPILDVWDPTWGVWYSNWDCYYVWWEKNMYPGSQRIILPFPLAAMDDDNRDAFLTNVISVFNTGNAIDPVVEALPKAFALKQNFPNPFNPTTSIAFEMPSAQNVRLTVYNMLGQSVRTLVNDYRTAGRYLVHWDGRDDSGHMVGSGIYFYQIQAGSFTKTAKMVFLK
ncbi:MAG: T9SS type A sorting domain-containing protein [Fidelibacterota bacterium]